MERIADAIRMGLTKVEVGLDSDVCSDGGPYAVVSGNGSVEAGLWSEGLSVQRVTTFDEAKATLARERSRVLKCLLRESHKIFRGVEAGNLERGDCQTAFAQLVTPGKGDGRVRPLGGFSICCDPAEGQGMRLRRSALEESWDDLFPTPRGARSQVSEEQIEAYQKTRYVVSTEPPFTLRVGKASAELRSLYTRERTDCAAFITAWNWGGKRIGRSMNDRRQQSLISDVQERGFRYLPGKGLSTSKQWKSEQSLLVLGMGKSDASAMGREYMQNAIVWCGSDAVPELVILR